MPPRRREREIVGEGPGEEPELPGALPGERLGQGRGFVGRIVDYLRDRWRLAKLPIKNRTIDMTSAGEFDHKFPGNTIIITRAVANDMDDFLIEIRYNREDATPVLVKQVMVLGFEYTELFISWPAVADGAADLTFGTEI